MLREIGILRKLVALLMLLGIFTYAGVGGYLIAKSGLPIWIMGPLFFLFGGSLPAFYGIFQKIKKIRKKSTLDKIMP